MISASDLGELLTVLQAHGVKACTLGDMAFELGPVLPAKREPLPVDPREEDRRRRRELDELTFASAGG